MAHVRPCSWHRANSELMFGKGMRRSTFQWKKGFFSEKGGGISVNEGGLGRISTGKAIQWRGSGHSLNRRTLKTEKLLSSSPSQNIGSYQPRPLLRLEPLHGGRLGHNWRHYAPLLRDTLKRAQALWCPYPLLINYDRGRAWSKRSMVYTLFPWQNKGKELTPWVGKGFHLRGLRLRSAYFAVFGAKTRAQPWYARKSGKSPGQQRETKRRGFGGSGV